MQDAAITLTDTSCLPPRNLGTCHLPLWEGARGCDSATDLGVASISRGSPEKQNHEKFWPLVRNWTSSRLAWRLPHLKSVGRAGTGRNLCSGRGENSSLSVEALPWLFRPQPMDEDHTRGGGPSAFLKATDCRCWSHLLIHSQQHPDWGVTGQLDTAAWPSGHTDRNTTG